MLAAMQEAAHASALLAAVQSGILARLAAGERDPDAIAAALELHPLATRRVVELLALYLPADDSPAALARCERRLAALRAAARERGEPIFVWDRLPGFLRSGLTLDQQLERARVYAEVTPGLASPQAQPARRLAEALGAARGATRILDVGAGSGVWSLALLDAHPGSTATALDLEPVLPRFFERAEKLGLRDRVDALAGDWSEVSLPRAHFDRIVAAQVLHLDAPERVQALLARLLAALAPAGELVVVDVFSDGSRAQERLRASYALHLALRVRDGYPHRAEHVATWLRGAGCGEVELGWLAEGQPLGYLRARREPPCATPG